MGENQQQLAIIKPGELHRMAQDVAGVCKEIVKRTAVSVGGKKHVQVEGWEAIATAHGCFAGAGNVKRVYDEQDGMLLGWSAEGYVRNGAGVTIGTGEGFVGVDEKDGDGHMTWGSRAEYACRAMAQTRAISRACRGVFAHVVVLMNEGLDTTPAEEADPTSGMKSAAKATTQHRRSGGNPADEPIHVWQDVVIHWGRTNKGKKLGDLSSKSLDWYQNDWHPTPHNGKMNAMDVRLRRALDISMGKEQADEPATEQVNEVPKDAKRANTPADDDEIPL